MNFELTRIYKGSPRTIQINDGSNTPFNIHPPQLAKRITTRRAPNAGTAVSTPHGVFNIMDGTGANTTSLLILQGEILFEPTSPFVPRCGCGPV